MANSAATSACSSSACSSCRDMLDTHTHTHTRKTECVRVMFGVCGFACLPRGVQKEKKRKKKKKRVKGEERRERSRQKEECKNRARFTGPNAEKVTVRFLGPEVGPEEVVGFGGGGTTGEGLDVLLLKWTMAEQYNSTKLPSGFSHLTRNRQPRSTP